ncbi:MAG TPA: MASE4 domain-containing protein [Gemmatimonadaceae bacterium]|jgi:signal transduction histidine kinase|nr:MASE4 domain-containing protein [Gemmatimonadaceae bacterium]
MSGELTGAQSFLISSLPPSARQERLAAAVAACLVASLVVTFTFRNAQLPRNDSFTPIANAILFFSNTITMALLFAQFAVARNPALLALASGYLFTALLIIPHALTFPGAFAPAGLLGANLQTTAWLYMLQHLGFLAGAIGYTILRGRRHVIAEDRSAAVAILADVLGVALIAAAVIWLVTSNAHLLPPIMKDQMHTSAAWRDVGSPLLVALSLASIVVYRKPRVSMIDLWLQVAILAWVLETLNMAMIRERFSLVFYVSRTLGVVSASLVLLALFSESTMLHARLVLTLAARRQEREGHRTAMDVMLGWLAHELRQPLAAIRLNAEAGARQLSAPSKDLGEVEAILDDIRADAGRASEMIDSVRQVFVEARRDRQLVDANALVREAATLLHLELETSHVALHLHLAPDLPLLRGHHGQLIEVLVNGVTNAVESLALVAERSRWIDVHTAQHDGGWISIIVEDAGAGLAHDVGDQPFEPFYSTKFRGSGLGLSICHAIVEGHGGSVALLPREGGGAVFHVELPPAEAEGHPSRGVDIPATAPAVELANRVSTLRAGELRTR